MKTFKLCLLGFYLILQSLSGTFSLITLLVIGLVTWHSPLIGGIALASFATVCPTLLGYFEHKETLAQIAVANPQPPAPPIVVVDNPRGNP